MAEWVEESTAVVVRGEVVMGAVVVMEVTEAAGMTTEEEGMEETDNLPVLGIGMEDENAEGEEEDVEEEEEEEVEEEERSEDVVVEAAKTMF